MECVSDVFALFLRGSLPLKKILTNGSEAEGGGRREEGGGASSACSGSSHHWVVQGVVMGGL